MSQALSARYVKPGVRESIRKYGLARWFFVRARGDSPFQRILIHLALIGLCIVAAFPLYRILTISLRPSAQLLTATIELWPEGATADSYRRVIVNRDFLLWIWNSLVITTATCAIGLTIASTSAYAFSRWDFPGKRSGLVFLLATQMIPGMMLMVPLYILAANLNLINTWRGLIIAYSVQAVPFSIWILKGYYDTIPFELEQAAMVDGSSRLGAFYRIILPLAKPALAIAFLFNFMQAWNDYILARIMLQRTEMYTWPLGLNRLQGEFTSLWSEFAAASLMISIPVIILFLASSRYLLGGLTVGSVKQ